MTDVPTARHLASITREAAGRAYEADATIAGKIATWFLTILTTLHAGGLLAALQYSDKLARAYEAQCALLAGLVATLLGGGAALIHYNALADRWRHEMHMEIEGSVEISQASEAMGHVADAADRVATTLLVVSIFALGIAGTFAI
jgi:hypothetical protein